MGIKTWMSLVTGILVTLLLWLLKVDFPQLWGLLAFLLNFVPNIGSIIAAAPAVLLALVQYDVEIALYVVAGYVAINVLIGNMSFVGPRPDVIGYADKLADDDRIIVSVKPGITGPATLKYRNEEKLLALQLNPKEYNDTIIWKEKIKINKRYVENWSFLGDLKSIFKTFFP